MHLALFTHNILRGDGQGRVVYEIAKRALADGATVTLAADRVAPDLLDAGARWLKIQPRLRRINLFKVREFVAMANRAATRLPAGRCVLHAHGYTLTRPHHVNTAHMVHTAWGRSPDHTARTERGVRRIYHRIYTALNSRWEMEAFRAAQTIAAVSELVAIQLRECGVDANRIRVIGNGVDPEEFAPGPAARPAGLPRDVPTGLFVGDLRIALKNMETILAALAQVHGLHLAVVGDTRGSPFPERATALGLSDRVHFLGFRNDVAALMRSTDFFVFPSRYESFSLVLLEAMAAGLPVITARTVGAASLVTADCGMVLEDPNDVAGLASCMRHLAESATLRARMGAAAREVALAHSWRRMTDQYMAIYQEAEAKL